MKLPVLILAFAAATSAQAADIVSDWSAAAGLPTATTPQWIQYGAGGSLSGEVLTIQNGTGYYQDETQTPGFDTTGGFSVEARVRYVSGSTSADARDVIGILFSQADTFGNTLYIGNGRVFIQTEDMVRGATAYVDTAAFHTYRIDLAAQSGGGASAISVYYDGALLLSGQTFASTLGNGTIQSLSFGDISGLASGTSEWQFVRNAVAPVPEPATWAMMLAGLGLAGGMACRRTQHAAALA